MGLRRRYLHRLCGSRVAGKELFGNSVPSVTIWTTINKASGARLLRFIHSKTLGNAKIGWSEDTLRGHYASLPVDR